MSDASTDLPGRTYKVWAMDDVVYGPIQPDAMRQWIAELRVLPDMWVYPTDILKWVHAKELDEFAADFRRQPAAKPAPADNPSPLIEGVPPGTLRKAGLFADMDDQQLGRFAQFMQVAREKQFNIVVREGEKGDVMYLVLEGILRVRRIIGGRETVMATLKPGDFFGEMSLFDKGERSADVVVNEDATLLKISRSAFQELIAKIPEVATPFLHALGRTMAGRIRADNDRLKRDVLVLRATRTRSN